MTAGRNAKWKPRETKQCAVCGGTFARRDEGESPTRFKTRRFCSQPCSKMGQRHRGGAGNGQVTIPREPVARILERELALYGELRMMCAGIARATGRERLSVERRVNSIVNDNMAGLSRDKTRQLPNEVLVRTVEWLLDGLALPDAWHVELADWNRLLIAYEAGHITLSEYRQQSAFYNVLTQAETAAVSTKSKATVSDRKEGNSYARAA